MRPHDAPDDAHYLHERTQLQALLVPPIEDPRVLSWIPKSQRLVVVNQAGSLFEVEPVFGTRKLGEVAGEPGAIAVDHERVAVMSRDGTLGVWTLPDLVQVWRGRSDLQAQRRLIWCGAHLILSGDDGEGKRWAFAYDTTGRLSLQIHMPSGAVVGAHPVSGELYIVRSTVAGLRRAAFGAPPTLGPHDRLFDVDATGMSRRDADNPPTSHRLTLTGDGSVLGIADGGVVVWPAGQSQPTTVRIGEVVTANLSFDGAWLGIGTRGGGVAIADLRNPAAARVNPQRTEGHASTINQLEFAPRGQWLATLADKVRLWTASN